MVDILSFGLTLMANFLNLAILPLMAVANLLIPSCNKAELDCFRHKVCAIVPSANFGRHFDTAQRHSTSVYGYWVIFIEKRNENGADDCGQTHFKRTMA